MLKNGDMIPKLHIEILHLNSNYFDENPLSTENNKDKSLKVVRNVDNNNNKSKKSFISNVSSINTNDLMLTENLESTKRINLSSIKSKRKVHWIDRKYHHHHNKIPLMEIIEIQSFKQYNFENSYKGNLDEVMSDKKKCCYSKCNII
jgi:hypothetical protein